MPWCYREDCNAKINSGKAFIINLDDKGNGGTHWVAARRIGDIIYYADPFGTVLNGYPPEELRKLNLKIISNSKAWQRPSTNYCGYYSYYFAKALNKLKENATQKELEDALWESIR